MKIGPLELDHPLMLAPMENVTDTPFRWICKERGADVVFTEFASSEALIRDAIPTLNKIKISEKERPIAIQIFGNSELSIEKAVAMATFFQPDFIDINCGCWVKKVALKGAGAGLLKDLKQLEKIIQAAKKGTSLPITVKTRLGWDSKNIVIHEVAKICEQNGIQALTLHCRTREQGLQGKADWSYLEKIKNSVSIPIIGNGDLFSPQDIHRMFETGCDGVMIARGALSNPWIFEQTHSYLKTGILPSPPTLEEQIQTALKHLKLAIEMKGEGKAVKEFRKFLSTYFHGFPHASKLRSQLMGYTHYEEILNCLSSRNLSDFYSTNS